MNIFNDIIKWNKSRNNMEFNCINEYQMLSEELTEFLTAYNEENSEDMADALCDIIVVAIGAIWKLGYDPTKAMEETLKEINSRKQCPLQKEVWEKWGASGKWEKMKNQSDDTRYKADYTKARNEI